MTNSKRTEALKLALEALEAKGDAWIVLERKAKAAIREALAEQPAQQGPVGCEGAIVNGHVYADRLEHDYKFECEAGPLHMCTDWVEFRRCFEWLAQHTSPPAQQEPFTYYRHYDGGMQDWPDEKTIPLYTTPQAQRTWVGLTDEDIKEAEWLLSAIKEHEAYTLQEQLLVEGVDVFARAIEAKLREKNGITKEQT